MKKYLIVFLLVLSNAIAYGYTYRVNVKSSLNMRQEPSDASEVVCQIPDGERVFSSQQIEYGGGEGWLKVSYNEIEGYVATKFLSEDIEEVVQEPGQQHRPWYYLLTWEGEGYRWMAYILMGMALLMWLELKFLRKMDLEFTTYRGNINTYKWVNSLSVIAFAAVSISYVYLMGNNAMWFIMDVSPWYYAVINFIFLTYVFIDILAFAIRSVEDIAESADVKVGKALIGGFLTLMLGAVLYVGCHLFHINPQYVYIFTGATQVVTLLFIIFKIALKGDILSGLFAAIIYAIGSVAVLVLLLPITLILFIVFAACLAFALAKVVGAAPGGIFSDVDGRPNGTGATTVENDGREVAWIINPEGKRIKLRQLNPGSDLFQGSDGHDYHKTSLNGFSRYGE